jgi:hypothetical protein
LNRQGAKDAKIFENYQSVFLGALGALGVLAVKTIYENKRKMAA